MRDGHQVPADGIDRGPLLVYPLEHWQNANTRFMFARLRFDLFVVTAIGVTMVLVSLLFAPIIGVVMIMVVGLVGLSEALAYRGSRRVMASGGALPGVYTNGVELPMFPVYTTRLFIPWSEMEDGWVKGSRMFDDVLFIAVKGSRWRWRAPGRLFGQEGMLAVVERAMDPATLDLEEPQQPAPRLVVYSAEGAKLESVPEDL
jgi:hypothetical protein